jgi:hypothetical protein
MNKFFVLLTAVIFLGGGCPKQTQKTTTPPATEEMRAETSTHTAPDDGLDAALNDLDMVDTEADARWESY